MAEAVATTPVDVAQPSIDDRIAAKFGLTEQPAPTEEAPETPPEATDQEAEAEEVELEAPEEETPQAPETEVLTHNGQEKRVSKEQMRDLAQKGFDYEFNMVQNKAERQRLQGMATALEAQQALHVQVIEHVSEAKAYDRQLAAYKDIDWIKFANEAPIEAFQAKQVYDQLERARNDALGKAQQVAAKHGEAQSYVTQEQLAHENAKLLEKFPEWKDEAKRNKDQSAIIEDLGKQFTSEEIKNWGRFLSDHRIVAMVRNDFRYRHAVEAGKAKKGQLQGLPQPAKPGARQQAPSPAMNVAAAKTDLRKARSPETRKAAEDRMIAAKFGIKL